MLVNRSSLPQSTVSSSPPPTPPPVVTPPVTTASTTTTPTTPVLTASNTAQRSGESLRGAQVKASPGFMGFFKRALSSGAEVPSLASDVQSQVAAANAARSAAASASTTPSPGPTSGTANASQLVGQLQALNEDEQAFASMFGDMIGGEERTIEVELFVGAKAGVGWKPNDDVEIGLKAEVGVKAKAMSSVKVACTGQGFELTLDTRRGGEASGGVTVGVGLGADGAAGAQHVVRTVITCDSPEAAARVIQAHQAGQSTIVPGVTGAKRLEGRRLLTETNTTTMISGSQKSTAVSGGLLATIRSMIPGLNTKKVEFSEITVKSPETKVVQRNYSTSTFKSTLMSWLSLGIFTRKRTATKAELEVSSTRQGAKGATGTTTDYKAEMTVQIDSSKVKAITTKPNAAQAMAILVDKETDRLVEMVKGANAKDPGAFDVSPAGLGAIRTFVENSLNMVASNLSNMSGQDARETGFKTPTPVVSAKLEIGTGSIVTLKVPFARTDGGTTATPGMRIDMPKIEVGSTSNSGVKAEVEVSFDLGLGFEAGVGAGGGYQEKAYMIVATADGRIQTLPSTTTPTSVSGTPAPQTAPTPTGSTGGILQLPVVATGPTSQPPTPAPQPSAPTPQPSAPTTAPAPVSTGGIVFDDDDDDLFGPTTAPAPVSTGGIVFDDDDL
jgi:hypothetical protein